MTQELSPGQRGQDTNGGLAISHARIETLQDAEINNFQAAQYINML